ncbi:hypothetical protein F2P81_018517 [Scophthalmus maximus]|uniref:MRH domain-containing protein n=1 Tax=Scophthalmus maximus TaxID=52904 RepID=A0A6A4SGC6_SCOMX|nr:hypothetical protein F2P81_018517 [Scophthalmus maximus]
MRQVIAPDPYFLCPMCGNLVIFSPPQHRRFPATDKCQYLDISYINILSLQHGNQQYLLLEGFSDLVKTFHKIKDTHGALDSVVDEDPHLKAADRDLDGIKTLCLKNLLFALYTLILSWLPYNIYQHDIQLDHQRLANSVTIYPGSSRLKAAKWEATNLKKVEEAYDTVNMEISDLRKKLAIDYGTDWEFLFLNSQCYKLKVYEYTYTLCPFNQVTQENTAGTEVSLGKWGMWAGTPKNQYSQMVYENGEPCWQGGSRSATVTLTCGTETALRSVKEPSKCQYIMDFQTPVACQPVLKQRGIHSEARHFPCGVDERQRVAVGGWKAEL